MTSAGSSASSGGGRRLGHPELLDDGLDELPDAAAVLGRDREHVAEAEPVELGERGLLLVAGGVHLVHRDEERLPGAAQQVRDGAVDLGEPLAPVHDEHDGGGLVHGELRLLPHLAR